MSVLNVRLLFELVPSSHVVIPLGAPHLLLIALDGHGCGGQYAGSTTLIGESHCQDQRDQEEGDGGTHQVAIVRARAILLEALVHLAVVTGGALSPMVQPRVAEVGVVHHFESLIRARVEDQVPHPTSYFLVCGRERRRTLVCNYC